MVTKKTIRIGEFLVGAVILISLIWLAGPTYDGPAIFWLSVLGLLIAGLIHSGGDWLSPRVPIPRPTRIVDPAVMWIDMNQLVKGFLSSIEDHYRSAPKIIHKHVTFDPSHGEFTLWLRDPDGLRGLIHQDLKLTAAVKMFSEEHPTMPFRPQECQARNFSWFGRCWAKIRFVYIP